MYLRQVIVEKKKNDKLCRPVELTSTEGQSIHVTNEISVKHAAKKLVLMKVEFLLRE
jgi:hypothetical protein